jgi:hypothetical protein
MRGHDLFSAKKEKVKKDVTVAELACAPRSLRCNSGRELACALRSLRERRAHGHDFLVSFSRTLQ